jgi:hypothetical protein
MLQNNAAEILILLFFIITYLVSVLEKISAWNATVTYYSNHFKATILHKVITLLLIQVIIFEIAAFTFCSLGLYFIMKEESFYIAKLGLEISAFTLLAFLFAQRLAKDYAGAMNVTIYFILNIIGIYLLT